MRTSIPRQGLILLVIAALGALLAYAGGAQAAAKAAPVNTAEPTVSGTPKVGQTLTAGNGTWTNSPTSYDYQWLRCNTSGNSCVNVPNGTQKSYTLVGADRGHAMRVRVTASNTDGSANADSAQTDVVAPAGGSGVPRNTDRPIISGTPTVGETLTTDEGSWSGTPTSYAFRWQRCDADNIVACADVPGATSRSYVLHDSDVGYRLRVRVTASNASGATTVRSATTAVVQPKLKVTNQHPTLSILSVRFLGSTVYARFRVCDDSLKNLTILATDTRPGKASYTRRFTTLTAPRPCGVYTRHWTPVSRFRGPGRYTVVLKARDTSGFASAISRRTFLRH